MAKPPSPSKASSMKKRAEARLRAKPKPGRNRLPRDAAKLIHELEVHQVELETQNEELRRAQAEIEKSRTRYSDLYDFAPVAYLTCNQKGMIREANLKAAELFGLSRGALIRSPLFQLLAESTRDTFRNTCRQAIQSPGKHDCEFPLTRKDGTRVWVRAESVGMEEEDGKVNLIRSLFWDITERKAQESEIQRLNAELESKVQARTNALQVVARELQARKSELEAQVSELRWTQQELSRSEERFRTALKNSPVFVFNQDQELRYTWVFNLPPAMKDKVIVGKTDREIFPAEEAARLTDIKRRVFDTAQGVRTEVSVSMNGALRDLDLTIEPQYGPEGRICGITCAAMDVSDRKLLEKERAQAERSRLLEAFFTSTITPLVFLDRDFKFIRVNEAFAGTCRRDASEFAGRSYFEFFPGKEKEEIFRKAVETKIPFRAFADVFHCPNEPKWGELCWNWNLTPILEPGGEVEFLVLALNDVTEQTRAQENIRRSEELLRTVMELLPVGVCVFDREGKVRQCNPVGDKILGDAENLSPGPFMSGRAWRTDSGQSVGPEEWGPVRAIRQGEPSFNEELEIEAPDGVRKALLASTVPLRDEGGGIPGAVVVIEDITGRKRAETVFRQQQKMEALGTLAGGIAHDLNNMLNPIVINTELALMDIKEGKTPAPQFLQLVLKSAERGRKLVNQVITFSRQKDQARMKLDIAPLVREGLKFLRSSLPSNIEVRKKLDTGGLQVLADPTQIQQVLSNLVSNAAYAMREEGGTLGVSLEVVDVDPETAAGVAGLKPAPYLRLTVSDTGHGMDKETLEKAFNPFFTTKSPREGIGMGLSIVHGIVQHHDGAVSISSEGGKGTTVQVFLPLSKDAPPHAPGPAA